MARIPSSSGGTFHGSQLGQGPMLALPSPSPLIKRLLILHAVGFGVVFVLDLVSKGASTGPILRWVGLAPEVWREQFPLVPIWQLASYALLHSVANPMHIVQNLLYLYFFGVLLEGIVGSSRFFVTYVASILIGGLLYLAQGLVWSDVRPVVGASGGVFGILVAAATLQPHALVYVFFVPVRLRWLAIGLVAIEVLFLSQELRFASQSGVAHMVHLGGALWGFVAVKTRWIWIDPMHRLAVRRAIHDEEKRISDAQRMDALLEKINREGMSSLTRREREFLKRVSARR